MPLFSEAASAIRNRFRFQDNNNNSNHHNQSSSSASELTATVLPSVKSSPDLLFKSASKEPSSSLAIKSFDDGDDNYVQTASSNSTIRGFEFREDPSFWKDHNVQVIIRIRPLSSSEISVQGHSRCVRQDSSQSVTWIGYPESRFTFDYVADENVSQEMLFKVAGVPMVENCVGGYNSCMFAYGQTGSGKTHTMLGDIEEGTRRHSVNCGMTPRVFEYLFSRIQKEKEARREEKIKFTCRCSFLEIYNEQILDLLDPSSVNLQIREDTKKGVHVENLREVEVTCARDVIQQLVQGAANRKVAATNMNRASSRSHSVFTCVIESKWESQGVTHHRFSRLNLVDLAGSERQKSSGAEGERLKEATNINKSLSTLGLVIMNLVNMSNGKSLHVPYRDSKLTFLLQDSLGGNAKTIIIANISPSSCCSLETLSTLKFAQRAKFIKNHAIVNEDASGDVLAMRTQIQNLKKEVARLRNMVNGGVENHEGDASMASIPGTPGPFKWEGFHQLSTPLTTSHKRMSQNEYEVALVGAFRREKDKDTTIQTLTAENQAAMQLAKQREDEIQGLKMRLRFREAGIKRLEAVASGKISAENHWLKEKEEHLKEIEVLRTQVDRNQEVTRFAMENLRLKEEIRRLKSFYEEGERERMNEQITALQNKLLEALDWKLMHESDPSTIQKGSSKPGMDIQDDGNLLFSGQESASPWRTSNNEENEFLRMQAIHNQAELDALRKKLDFCIEEKEKLERHVQDLVAELEAERSSKSMMTQETLNGQSELPAPTNNQIELQTMVDAIAAASQREAEAHETAIMLSKENDELRMKLKVLIEDNNKLIELYERAVSENQTGIKVIDGAQNCQEDIVEDHGHHVTELSVEKELESSKEVDSLKQQLVEMHEENDKLMGLYEMAMQERDEFKRRLSSAEQRNLDNKGELNRPEKLVEVDGGQCLKLDESFKSEEETTSMPKEAEYLESYVENGGNNMELVLDAESTEANSLVDESGLYEVNVQNEYCQFSSNPQTSENPDLDTFPSLAVSDFIGNDIPAPTVQNSTETAEVTRSEEIEKDNLIEDARLTRNLSLDSRNDTTDRSEEIEKDNLIEDARLTRNLSLDSRNDTTDGTLENKENSSTLVDVILSEDLSLIRKKLQEAQEKLSSSAESINALGSLERAVLEVDELSKEIEGLEDGIQIKQRSYESSKHLSTELQERRVLLDKKLSALKYSLSSFASSIGYFEQREAQAKTRLNSSSACLNQKREELARLQVHKDEIMDAQRKLKQSEVELKNNLAELKLKVEEENRRLENDRVLFAIDNIGKTDAQASERNWHLSGKATDLLKSEEEKTKLQNQVKQTREKLGTIRKEAEDLDKKCGKVENEMQVVNQEIQNGLQSVEEMSHKLQSIIKEKEMVLAMKEDGQNEFKKMILEYHESMFEAMLKEEEMKILDEELQIELRKIEDLQRAKAVAAKRKTQLLEAMRCSNKIGEDLHSVKMSVMELNSLLGDYSSNDS